MHNNTSIIIMFAELEGGRISSTAQNVVMPHVSLLCVIFYFKYNIILCFSRFEHSLNLFGLYVPLDVISIIPCGMQWDYTSLVFHSLRSFVICRLLAEQCCRLIWKMEDDFLKSLG